MTELTDVAARRTALTVHDRTFLVEAGAGSGKTAILAGRIALMLADGVAAREIAAVTFTELAASELVERIRHFVAELAAGGIPPELDVALPNGLDAQQAQILALAADQIDDITCSTIHGFCQRMIRPYPVEADIDPGATVIDPEQADLRFSEIVDDWLREALDADADGLLPELVEYDDMRTLALVREVAAKGRSQPLGAGPLPGLDDALHAVRTAAGEYARYLAGTGIEPGELTALADAFAAAADALPVASEPTTPARLVALLAAELDPCLSGRVGGRAYQNKGRWSAAAAVSGLSKADGTRFFDAASRLHGRCHSAWDALKEAVAARVLAELVPIVAPVGARYRAWKRAAALLDFDDLLHTARTLLATRPEVRAALGRRYARLLVDEFQDTDPVQSEVFWRLAGDGVDDDWRNNRIRPGALFLVGDPKQAIYRFRGADVAAYVRARDALKAADPAGILSISTNFRSLAPILAYVNERFHPVLSAVGQPGFFALDAYHRHDGDAPTVAALDVPVPDLDGVGVQNRKRDAEAEAVADACATMIGALPVLDRAAGAPRPCRAGDIALLAPTGTELWRYEEALEMRGLAVTTQAGKGFFHRQEVKDLIALARVLADGRDRLAFGALLRGPVVGLTDEELLDITHALPRDPERPDAQPRLSLYVDAATIAHPNARDIVERLQSLGKRHNGTTPHRLLAEAVDVLRLRAVLLARHGGRAERPLANVDLFLSMARAYDVRGIAAFARAVTAHWAEGSRVQEGRPDAQEGAVTIYTMHAAKGLEWPVVIPINAMGAVKDEDGILVDPATGTISRTLFGLSPVGHGALRDAERDERRRERQRLWYVAATRARQLLVLPRLDARAGDKAWCSLVDLALDALPPLDLSRYAAAAAAPAAPAATQSRDAFRAEAAAIAARQRRLVWRTPSRHEGDAPVEPDAIAVDLSEFAGDVAVQGGRTRGLVLHKLMEEVLTGELDEDAASLSERAQVLLAMLGAPEAHDPAELAACVARTLALPEVAAHRPRLVPELPVYAFADDRGAAEAMAGIADAVALGANGAPMLVIDWKSDVAPAAATVLQYQAQIRAYLAATGVSHGLLVFMTSGRAVAIDRR